MTPVMTTQLAQDTLLSLLFAFSELGKRIHKGIEMKVPAPLIETEAVLLAKTTRAIQGVWNLHRDALARTPNVPDSLVEQRMREIFELAEVSANQARDYCEQWHTQRN